MPFCESDGRAVSRGGNPDLRPSPEGSQPATSAEVRALDAKLDVLIAEVRALSARGQRPVAVLNRDDRARLANILPAIVGALGSESFVTRDLFDEPGLRVVFGTLSIKQVGRLLSRAEGIPIEGYLVERCGIEINVTLWRVVVKFDR